MRWLIFTALLITGLGLLPVSAAQAAGPGSWSQAQINTAIQNGVAYLATQQNADGSFGSDDPAETGMALAAFGVLANGNFSSLSSAYQTDVKNAITYLLNNQDTTHSGPPDYFGSWSSFGGYHTYSTGLALLGLAPFTTVNPGVPTAIANGRTFLGVDFEGPANTGCTSTSTPGTSTDYCGGWNYDADYGRSDESNSGYAISGLEVTGGVPASFKPDNINWNHHVQVVSTNPYTLPTYGGCGRNDGGGSYQPGYAAQCSHPFSSNANDSGTMLFSYADDNVAAADPNVAAAIKFDQDVLNAYELQKGAGNPLAMIYHDGATEDGACTPDAAGCDWHSDSSEGGFHYSMFTLTKGLGSYIPPNASDPTNWYAKVVDLLLSSQNADGSWSQDGRDDFSTVFATALSVAALGKVAVVSSACTMTSGSNTAVKTATQNVHVENAVSTDLTATQHLVLRSLTGGPQYFRLTRLSSAVCHDNPSYPIGEDGPHNTFTGDGSGSFGTDLNHNAPGYSIHFELGDRGDSTTADNTAADTVTFVVKNGGGTTVWQGTGKLISGSEEISG